MGKRVGVAVLAGLVACGGARAATYPAIYSFGDSLSDVGNLSAATAGTIPLPGFYYNGRFSNGPNWLDDLSAKLGLSTGPALLGGDNFAVGGAQTGETIVNSPPVPVIGLTDQVKSFQIFDPSPAPGALYTLDIGANDILNAVTALKNGKISFSDMTTTFLNQAVANTLGAIGDLYADGMRTLLYYEAPDLSVVPDYKDLGAQFATDAGALAMDFNADVLNGVKALDLSGLTVFDVPIFSTIDKIVADPSAFGLTNVTTPCFSGDVESPGTVCGDQDQYLFWDGEHPTRVGHALTADLAYDVLTGTTDPALVPEPSTWAMMLIGFAGLGFASWRARQTRAAKVNARR
jgi:phospholipase/lecithinase/hemolysin